jgi:hypothetical protein
MYGRKIKNIYYLLLLLAKESQLSLQLLNPGLVTHLVVQYSLIQNNKNNKTYKWSKGNLNPLRILDFNQLGISVPDPDMQEFALIWLSLELEPDQHRRSGSIHSNKL